MPLEYHRYILNYSLFIKDEAIEYFSDNNFEINLKQNSLNSVKSKAIIGDDVGDGMDFIPNK